MSDITIRRAARGRSAIASSPDAGTRAPGACATAFRSEKITAEHLQRLAIVYVRQSTVQQVLEHRESTARQYALADRAVALGWPAAAVEVIDEDQGHSGSSAEGRHGFQRLLAEVSSDRVGLILGLEMSRLARSCKDWHALLEVCAIYRTLLGDTDGLYDPSQYNDRLLLGLKGTMSEAELHILKNRLLQGMWNKAERGEVLNHAPLGYVRTISGDFVIDPDEQVQMVVRLIFEQFQRQGSVNGLLRWLVRRDVKLPVRPHFGVNRGELEWRRPNRVTLLNVLHHPIYAGAYRWGHREVDPRKKVPGQAEYARFERDCPQQLSAVEREQIRALSQDLPALWRAETRRIAWTWSCAGPADSSAIMRSPVLCRLTSSCRTTRNWSGASRPYAPSGKRSRKSPRR